MTATKVEAASKEVHRLDIATQDLLESIRVKNKKALYWFITCWTILLCVAVYGVYKQVSIAAQSKQNIDCIFKDLSTPQQPGTQHKYISELSSQCNIKFTQ